MNINDLCFVGRLRGVFQMRIAEGAEDYFQVKRVGTVTGKPNRDVKWTTVHASRVFPILERLNNLVERVNEMDEDDVEKTKS